MFGQKQIDPRELTSRDPCWFFPQTAAPVVRGTVSGRRIESVCGAEFEDPVNGKPPQEKQERVYLAATRPIGL